MVDMNIVNPQYIRDYITDKFKQDGKLSASGREFIMASPYVENDWKRHFSINLDTGLWQCFKTGEKGNFVKLFAYLENITTKRAYTKLIIDNFFFDGEFVDQPEYETKKEEVDLTPVNINSHESDDPLVQKAWTFLFGRGLFNLNEESEDPYYVCKSGKYENRVIIPFKDEGEMFYFQARALDDRKPKYLNPGAENGPKPSEILYPYDESSDHLVVCEGPLDAISLQIRGVNATSTMGCSISRVQAEMLQDFNGKIVLGYDNDDAGDRGIKNFDTLRKEMRMASFEVCPPPSGYKDWNEAAMADEDLYSWVCEKSYAYSYENILERRLRLL